MPQEPQQQQHGVTLLPLGLVCWSPHLLSGRLNLREMPQISSLTLELPATNPPHVRQQAAESKLRVVPVQRCLDNLLLVQDRCHGPHCMHLLLQSPQFASCGCCNLAAFDAKIW